MHRVVACLSMLLLDLGGDADSFPKPNSIGQPLVDACLDSGPMNEEMVWQILEYRQKLYLQVQIVLSWHLNPGPLCSQGTPHHTVRPGSDPCRDRRVVNVGLIYFMRPGEGDVRPHSLHKNAYKPGVSYPGFVTPVMMPM